MTETTPVDGNPAHRYQPLATCEDYIGSQWYGRSPSYSLTWQVSHQDIFSRVCFCLRYSSALFRQLTMLDLQLAGEGIEHFCFQVARGDRTDECYGLVTVNLWVNQPRIASNYADLKYELMVRGNTIQKDCNQYASELMANHANRILHALISGSLEDKSC